MADRQYHDCMLIESTDIVSPARAVDWRAIEADYKAGIKPLRAIAAEHGITHGAIQKRAARDGWERDLQPRIHAKTAAMVAKQAVVKDEADERALIDANAAQAVAVVMESRAVVRTATDVVRKLWERVDPDGDLDQQSRIVDRLTGALARMVDLRYKVFGLAVGDAPPDQRTRPNSPAEDDAWRELQAKVAEYAGK